MRHMLRLGLLLSLPAVLWWGSGQHLPFVSAEDLPAVRIAFLRGGDLYVLDATSGTETRLTTSGDAGSPRWTDAGEALLFRAGNQMWRWHPGADPEPLSGADMPSLWSPDGSTLALVEPPSARWGPRPAGAEAGVWLERGGEGWRVTPPEPGIRWEPLAWAPDGRRLALLRMEFTTQIVKGTQVPLARATLWVTEGDVRAPSLRELPMPTWLQDREGVPDIAFWSPDGRFLTLGMGPADSCASCRADGVMWQAVPVNGGAPVALESGLAQGALAWAPMGRQRPSSGRCGLMARTPGGWHQTSNWLLDLTLDSGITERSGGSSSSRSRRSRARVLPCRVWPTPARASAPISA